MLDFWLQQLRKTLSLILLIDNMEKCTPKDCAHFIEKDRFGIYRHKFLWTIVVATIITIAFFIALCLMYRNSIVVVEQYSKDYNKELISSLPNVNLTKDSCYYVNEQLLCQLECETNSIRSMLEIQGAKLQSEFTVLSVWASVLMIVFLIFSIYSMFKTDELMRQSREELILVEEAKRKADENVQKVGEEASKKVEMVSVAADKEIQRIQEQEQAMLASIVSDLEKQKAELQNVYDKQAGDFEKLYNDYVDKLNKATETYQAVVEVLKGILKSDVEESSSKK